MKLPLNTDTLLSKKDFINTINRLPLFSNIIKQSIFLRDQLFGSQEVYVEAPYPVQVVLQTLNNRKFVFKFTSDVDKQEDFTVDPSQLMRIAKGDIKHIYQKQKSESNEEEYIVRLSSVSLQDTFIVVKHRMKASLDFIRDSEGLRDAIPDVLSEKFMFKIDSGSSESTFYHSIDRLHKATAKG